MTQLGAQMFTVREYTKDTASLMQTFQKLSAIGYESVQVSGIGADIPVQAVADGLKENNLICAATHIGFNDCLADLDAVIAKHKAWGCEYVGVGMLPREYQNDAAGVERFAKEASDVADALAKEGLKFVYHNHHFEFRKFDGKLGMDILMENSSRNFQFEIDTFWVQKGGSDVIQWLNKVAGRIDVVHFKDMAITDACEQRMAYIGEGNLNWKGIIQTCKDIGIKWYMVEQDDCQGRDPFECLKNSREFLVPMGVK